MRHPIIALIILAGLMPSSLVYAAAAPRGANPRGTPPPRSTPPPPPVITPASSPRVITPPPVVSIAERLKLPDKSVAAIKSTLIIAAAYGYNLTETMPKLLAAGATKEDLLTAAIQAFPKFSGEIVRFAIENGLSAATATTLAIAAAPSSEIKNIVSAAIKASPLDTTSIVTSASKAAPTQAKEIGDAAYDAGASSASINAGFEGSAKTETKTVTQGTTTTTSTYQSYNVYSAPSGSTGSGGSVTVASKS